jgi:CBS-domain-containing membrane protein
MQSRLVRASVHAGLLLVALALVAWATGNPFVFPSLGPSAFLLAGIASDEWGAYGRVVGGHVVGVVVGLAVYHLLAPGLVVTATFAPFSIALLRLGISGALSVALTTAGMMLTRTVHPPACATTLIVSLGFLASPVEGAIIAVAVVAMVVADFLLKRLAWKAVPAAGATPGNDPDHGQLNEQS